MRVARLHGRCAVTAAARPVAGDFPRALSARTCGPYRGAPAALRHALHGRPRRPPPYAGPGRHPEPAHRRAAAARQARAGAPVRPCPRGRAARTAVLARPGPPPAPSGRRSTDAHADCCCTRDPAVIPSPRTAAPPPPVRPVPGRPCGPYRGARAARAAPGALRYALHGRSRRPPPHAGPGRHPEPARRRAAAARPACAGAPVRPALLSPSGPCGLRASGPRRLAAVLTAAARPQPPHPSPRRSSGHPAAVGDCACTAWGPGFCSWK